MLVRFHHTQSMNLSYVGEGSTDIDVDMPAVPRVGEQVWFFDPGDTFTVQSVVWLTSRVDSAPVAKVTVQ